jgi:cysteinyl-tRNA synthetase
MRRKSIAIFFSLSLTIFFGCKKDNPPDNINFKEEMRSFVGEISQYSKNIQSDFIIIPQNGVQLITKNADNNGSADLNYLAAIDGIGQEDLFYGYNNDNEATPASERNWLIDFLDIGESNGVEVLVTDYCSSQPKMDDSFAQNAAKNYISFAADQRELNNIPTYPASPYNENSDSISNLSECRNFLYLINPDENFSSSNDFVNAVKATNYDLIIMDYFFNGNAYTQAQIEELKKKANGGHRLLICYMSIGEAEDYRYYWKSDWDKNPPQWLGDENPDWQGNFKVWYWEDEWKNIIYGNNDSYLKMIIDKGFHGVYLDIIDAFEYFED